MADLSLGIKGPTMDFSVALTIRDEDAPRILGFLAATGNGTPEECVRFYAENMLRNLLDETVRYERDMAMASAAAAIERINPV